MKWKAMRTMQEHCQFRPLRQHTTGSRGHTNDDEDSSNNKIVQLCKSLSAFHRH